MGGLDIVLDDGSHVGRHMISSFNVLFPRLADSGLYVAEDVCCAYWTKFGGGYGRSDTFIGLTSRLIDDIHHWWHRRGQKVSAARDRVAAVHVYDSVVVIDKAPVPRPVNSRLGAPSF
jgi:hypothetical protein